MINQNIAIMKNVMFVAAFAIGLSACSTVKNLLVEPSASETIAALKSILQSSAGKAVNAFKTIKQGEDALPDELKPVLATLKTLGLEDQIDDVEKAVVDASAVAAVESEAIIRDAIKEVKFSDAVSVVLGGEDAATQVLKSAMYSTIKNRYSERLESELNKKDVTKYWPMATSAYNLFAKEKVNGNLSDYISERAVDALFVGIAAEEKIIRGDYTKMGNAVVTKVFDYYTKNK